MVEVPDPVLDAVKNNKSSIVSEWLNNLAEIDEHTKPALVHIIQQSAHFISSDVIKLFQTPEWSRKLLCELINDKNVYGKTAIHNAAESCLLEKDSEYAILEVLTHLCEQGGDPTIICKQGKTAQAVTKEKGSKIATALLEVLETIKCQVSKCSSALEYAEQEIHAVHKALLHWAVFTERHQIVSQILIMHQRDTFDSIAHLLFDSDPNSPKSYQNAPVYTASLIGNPELFKVLLTQSGISLYDTLGQKQWFEVPLPNNTVMNYFVTPLSLILSLPQNHNLLDVCKELLNDYQVTSVDLSNTRLSSLPAKLFELGVYKLYLQNNKLTTLPITRSCYWLNQLNVSYNSLISLPAEMFELHSLETLNVSHNPLKSLPEKWWNTKSIKELDVSHTHLTDLSINFDNDVLQTETVSAPTCTHNQPFSRTTPVLGKVSAAVVDSIATTVVKTDCFLQCLNASHCLITTFPKLLAFFFPKLETLNLSNNKLESCCAINEFPISLYELDVSNNLLQHSKHKLFFINTDFFVNRCTGHKCLHLLSALKISNNVSLGNLTICEKEMNCNHVFFPKLSRLYMSNCDLKRAPEGLVDLQDLIELDISNNTELKIPHEISNLENLLSLNYDGLQDPVVYELEMSDNIKDKLIILRQEHSLISPTLKLAFIGDEEINIISLLTADEFQSKDLTINVVDKTLWCFTKAKPNVAISFIVWNFINQSEFISAIQCFLTDNALYVLCWQITTEKDHGIFKLKNWLLRIKDKASRVSVVIVGCHSGSFNNHLKKHLDAEIRRMHSNKQFYPHIVDILFVSSSKPKQDVIKLNNCLYDTACEVDISLGSRKLYKKLKDTKVPVAYFNLQQLISKKMMHIRQHQCDDPPILSWDQVTEMVSLRKQDTKRFFNDERDLAVAIKYMKQNGTIIHFDYPGLTDCYFIDPHWLYNLLCRVCTSPMLASCKIDTIRDDGKVNTFQVEKMLDNCGIPTKYYETIYQLLCKFEIAVPLDSNVLLLPSVLKNSPKNKLYSSVNCNFPRAVIPCSIKEKRCMDGTTVSVADCAKSGHKCISLHPTGMCYRRLFLAYHVPESFWRKLIPRFVAAAESFYRILINNCIPGVKIEILSSAGDAVICNYQCRCLYWSNGITLTFGNNDVLLCINGLYKLDKDDHQNTPISITVGKISTAQFQYDNGWKDRNDSKGDGLEVNVPDYMVHSCIEENGSTHTSLNLGSQVFSHVLDLLDELCTEMFDGRSEKGIYSNSYFHQLAICPYCYGDKLVSDTMTESVITTSYEHTIADTLHSWIQPSIRVFCVSRDAAAPTADCYGFDIQFCILKAQECGTVFCPRHKNIQLAHIAPDLMFEDLQLKTISATKVDKPVGKGSFGSVYKVKVDDHGKDVALKCFADSLVDGNLNEHPIGDLARVYADMRVEVNKLSTVDHSHIVQFLGLCVVSFSMLLEWAPKGSLSQILNEYREKDMLICPDTVSVTVYQVSSALAYLHMEKNIVHFDIKPANVLVFKYPQAGHFCFSKETSLNCESCYSEGGGVLVKLADLGISALLGPSGFQRNTSTPVYSAPEVLRYVGANPLTDKVDLFSVGISLFQLMTLRKLPPEGMMFEFKADIIAGRRPNFLPEDPHYPLALIECMQSCWAQESTQRPTAQMIEDYFKSPNCTVLKNTYPVEPTSLSFVLVTRQMDSTSKAKESVLIAGIEGDSCSLVSYEFVDQSSLLESLLKKTYCHPKLVRPKLYKTTVELNSCVKVMCQYGQHVWMVYDDGTLAACDMEDYSVVKDIVLTEPCSEPLAMLVVDHSTGLIAAAYANGLIVFLWGKNVTSDDYAVRYFHSSTTVWQTFKLNTIETCSVSDGHSQLWCSYDIGVIQIVKPPVSTSGETEIVKVVEIKEYCTDLPHDTSIVQLKCSPNQDQKSTVMYALHDGGLAISCWSVDVDPKLYTIIKPSLSSPVSALLPADHVVYIGDYNGSVHVITIEDIREGRYRLVKLPGAHRSKVDFLVSLRGNMSAQGFLSSCGILTTKDEQTRPNSMYYARQLDSVPCTVLMSVGVGYQELFTSQTSDSNCLISWALPC